MKISVAMATYNGEKYIEEQLNSIIKQLRVGDEIVISDDGSTDGTLDIIDRMKKQWSEMKVVEGDKRGVAHNFFKAVSYCKNEIIFLADQDDIWNGNKIEEVCKQFKEEPELELVMHNGLHFTENETLNRVVRYHKGWLRNWVRSCYWGCCMAFKKDLIEKYIEKEEQYGCVAHDQMIGLMAEKSGKVKYIDKDLILHRVHGANLTHRLPLYGKIKFRVVMMYQYIMWKRTGRSKN